MRFVGCGAGKVFEFAAGGGETNGEASVVASWP